MTIATSLNSFAWIIGIFKVVGVTMCISILLIGCYQKNESDVNSIPITDSVDLETDTVLYPLDDTKQINDSLRKNDENCPIDVISATAEMEPHGSGKILIKVKNKSNETIDAVQFNYLKFDAFGEPLGERTFNGISKTWSVNNRGTLTVHQTILPNKTTTAFVDVYGENKNLRKLTASPVKVSFANGEVWKDSRVIVFEAISGSNN